MSQWIRFEDGKSRALPEHATILKDGRLIVKHTLAKELDLLPGKYVELFHSPDVARIALRVIDTPNPYALKISSTAKGGIETFDTPMFQGGLPSAAIGLKGFLNSRRIGLASKVKGYFYRDAEDPQFIVFQFASPPEMMSASEHVNAQMGKNATAEKVAGDRS